MLRGKDQAARHPRDFHPMHKGQSDYDRLPKMSATRAIRTLGMSLGLKPRET